MFGLFSRHRNSLTKLNLADLFLANVSYLFNAIINFTHFVILDALEGLVDQ